MDIRMITALNDIQDNIAKVSSLIVDHETLPPKNMLDNIKGSLNRFFTDKKCVGVTITRNTDNEFFGIMIKPYNWNERILFDSKNDDYKLYPSFTEYTIELDHKLFAPCMNKKMITVLLLHDIYTMISYDALADIQAAFDTMCINYNISYSHIRAKHNTHMALRFCVFETLYRRFSIFCKHGEVLPPEFIQNCDYNGDDGVFLRHAFDDAYFCIQKFRNRLYDEISYNTLSLQWYFSWVKNYDIQNMEPINILKKFHEFTGSESLKSSINAALNQLGSVEQKYMNSIVQESGKRSLFSQIKRNGMKGLEDDLYEYSMRVKNISDQNDAILLMRQINSRVGIIGDYLEYEELSENERTRWERLYNKYLDIRDKLTERPVYSRKMYGLFTDYNALMQMQDINPATLNVMY